MRNSQAKSYIPISIFVVLFKHVRHPLQADARLHEKIEAHGLLVPPVIRPEQELHKLRRQPVPKRNERLAELAVGYISRAIHIEPIKEVPPRGEKPP